MRHQLVAISIASAFAVQPTAALAYIGPGLGVGAITVVFGVLAALVMATIALVWYPFKRLLRGRKPQKEIPNDQ